MGPHLTSGKVYGYLKVNIFTSKNVNFLKFRIFFKDFIWVLQLKRKVEIEIEIEKQHWNAYIVARRKPSIIKNYKCTII